MRIKAGMNEYNIRRGRIIGAHLVSYDGNTTDVSLVHVCLDEIVEMKKKHNSAVEEPIRGVPTCFGGDDRGYIQVWPAPSADGELDLAIYDSDDPLIVHL